MPVWLTKQVCPSSEYALWEAEETQSWKDNTVLSYEFALLRQTIQSVFSSKSPDLDKCLMSKMLDWTKPFEYMTEEEQEAEIAKQKERAGLFLGK